MNNIEKKFNTMTGADDEIPSVIKNFPMSNMKQMEDFEKFLQKAENYQNMVNLNFFLRLGRVSLMIFLNLDLCLLNSYLVLKCCMFYFIG